MDNYPQFKLVAQPNGFLYDCHSRAFGSVKNELTMVNAFAPLYLSQLFGISLSQWSDWQKQILKQLGSGNQRTIEHIIEQHPPMKSLYAASEIARMTYPEAERFLKPSQEGHPYELKEDALFQPNLNLTNWSVNHHAKQHTLLSDEQSFTVEHQKLIVSFCSAIGQGDIPQATALSQHLAPSLKSDLSIFKPLSPKRYDKPGIYFLGHSSMLIKTKHAGLLFDPMFTSHCAVGHPDISGAALHDVVDAVFVTHSHFDHYHLPSLLELKNKRFYMPKVPRASIVCEDMAERLKSLGCPYVKAINEETPPFTIGDIKIHPLRFVGEQFLTSEEYPQARNWGTLYIVETPLQRIALLADCGFEKDDSIMDVIQQWVDRNGPIDAIAAQTIALPVAFGAGDPDLQITSLTCANRAPELLQFMLPTARVTLAPSDAPRLAHIANAKYWLPYGEFARGLDSPVSREKVVMQLEHELSQSKTQVLNGIIGQRLPIDL